MMIIQWLPRQPSIVATPKMRNNYIGQDDKKSTNSFIRRVTLDGMEIVLCTDIDLPGSTNGQN